MRYLPIIFFFLTSIIYIYSGYRFINRHQSSITIGNQFRRKIINYAGNQAIFHGILYILMGLFACVWGFRALLGFSKVSWIWFLTGVAIIWVLMMIGSTILAIWSRMKADDSE